MAKFTYLLQSANQIPDATLTPATEDASYPATNAQSEPVAKVYRSTDATDQKILIEFATAIDANLFAVINHSLTSAATITLRGGSSPDPDGMEFETTIAYYRRTAWKGFAAQSWQYWSVIVDDPTNPAMAIEIGMLAMGTAISLSRNFDWGAEVSRETLNQVLESEYGVLTVGQNLFQRTRFKASWKATSTTERVELDTFLAGLERERKGMLFIPYPDESEAFYGRFMADYSLVRPDFGVTEVPDLEFVEDSVGRSIFAV